MFLITFLPGPEAILAPAAREITEGVMNMINPNREFQKNMQIAIAQKPELLQQLADIEKVAPGTMQNMGFGAFSPLIASIPESIEGEVKRTGREDIVKGQRVAFENALQQNENTQAILRQAAEEIAKNTELTTDAAYKMLIGQTQAGSEIEKAEATVKTEEAKVAPQVAQAKGKTAELQTGVITTTIADLPETGQIDLYDLANKFRRGQMDESSLALIRSVYTTPGTAQAFQDILNKLQRDAELAAQREMYNERRDASDTDKVDNLYWQRAAMFHTETNAGSIPAWHRYLSDGQARTRAIELAEKPVNELTFEERELVDVHNAQARQRNQDILTQERLFNKDFILITNRINDVVGEYNIKNDDDPRIAPNIAELNNILATRGALTGNVYTAHFGKVPGSDAGIFKFRKDIGVYFTDAEGEVVGPETVMSSPMTNSADVKVQTTVQNLNSLSPDERKLRLEQLKAEYPTHYEEVIKFFKE